MARKSMSSTELTALLDGQINDAISYDRSDLRKQRTQALEYRDGIMSDVPAEDGHSSVVSRDVADTIGWIAPGLARVFLASEHVGVYEPTHPKQEAFAKQATDYVNHVLMKDCNGYQVISMGLDDALLLGNGIVKHWWDDAPVYRTERLTGLTEAQYLMLAGDDDVEEVLEHSAYPDASAPMDIDPMTGLPAMAEPPMLHDCKIKRVEQRGRLMVQVLPPEEFLIERAARALNEEECRFCAHRWLETRSNLVRAGYDKETVYNLPAHSGLEDDDAAQARDAESLTSTTDEVDRSVEKVEVFECYTLVDYDGDGVAEWRRVVMGGGIGARNVLLNEEWGGDLPFTDFVPDPVPHRWRGRSIFDETQDIQRIKTVVLRQVLDNLYLTNNPQKEVVENQVVDMDELVNPRIGGIVRTTAAGTVREIVTPFVAEKAFPVLEYADAIVEKRTGVSRSTMALDPDALQNQTATAVQAQQASAYSKIELYARNIAENGMTRLFRCLLKLVCENQDRPRTIKLRDDWVEMDPRGWDAEMSVTVNTGLGAGSRDRDLRMLASILQQQQLAIQVGGPMNPLADISQLATTLRLMVETSGIKSPDRFFKEIGPEELQALQQQMSQPKPDPKMMEAQQKIGIERVKMEAKAAMDAQKIQADADLKVMQARAKYDTDLKELQAKLALQQEMQAGKLAAMQREAELKAQLREKEMLLEAQLTAQANAMNAQVAARQADTNINRPGGE